MTIARQVDAWGRVIFRAEDAAEIMLAGHERPETLWFAADPAVAAYNRQCDAFDAPDWKIAPLPAPTRSPAEEHAHRAATWHIPAPFDTVDVLAALLERCTSPEARQRVRHEMALFEARGLIGLLRMMFALVDDFRRRGVVWGVGRGSSVASYCLFLIGVHKLDPLRYGLPIEDFLK